MPTVANMQFDTAFLHPHYPVKFYVEPRVIGISIDHDAPEQILVNSVMQAYYATTLIYPDDVLLLLSANPRYVQTVYGRIIARREIPDKAQSIATMNYVILKRFFTPMAQKQLIKTYPAPIVWENLSHNNNWGKCVCGICRRNQVYGENIYGNLLEKVRNQMLDPYALEKTPAIPEEV